MSNMVDLDALAKQWESDSTRSRMMAQEHAQKYGTGNAIFIQLSTEADTLKRCARQILDQE